MKALRLGLTVVLLLSSYSFAAGRAGLVELSRQAAAAIKAKDWQSARDVLLKIKQEMGGNVTPRWLLRMASVEARLGHNREALHLLGQYSRMGLNYDVAKDPELAPLLTEKAYAAIDRQFRKNKEAISHAQVVCVIPRADLMPEDISYDVKSGTFVVTSIQHGGLYRVTLPSNGSSDCGLTEIALPETLKHKPTFAVRFDDGRQALWVTTALLPEATPSTALLLADEQKATMQAVPSEGLALGVLGDMALAADTVYVTDSRKGGIYRTSAAKPAALEKIGDAFSPQTPALAKDGRHLFVPDYSTGILVIDLAHPSGELHYLPHPDDVAVTGIDGLYLIGDSLFAIQNGTDPSRIVRFRLNREQSAIIACEVLERSVHSADINHAVRVGDSLFALANVGWNVVDDDGKLKPDQKFSNPILLRLPIKNGKAAD